MSRFKLKPDHIIVALLFILLMAWGPLYKKFIAPQRPAPTPAAVQTSAAAKETPSPSVVSKEKEKISTGFHATELKAAQAASPQHEPATPAAAEPAPLRPEERVALSNRLVTVTFSSWGGGIVSARFSQYRATVDLKSGPVVLDFTGKPALAMTGLAGLGASNDFTVAADAATRTVRIERRTPDGLLFTRTVSLGDRYDLRVTDVISNEAADAVSLPEYGIEMGPMRMPASQARGAGILYLGIDVQPSGGGEKVRHWANKSFMSRMPTLDDFFQPEERRGGCAMTKPRMTHPLPAAIDLPMKQDADWLSVKDKYFVQILGSFADKRAPEPVAPGYVLHATREVAGESANESATWMGTPVIREVSATLRQDPRQLAAGETIARRMSYYVGPKELASIQPLGNHREDVMEFGMFSPFCRVLLITLNGIYRLIPSYGLAIILLTVIIRVLFWPVTHKSTESMKKMQALQPQIAVLREKFKDKPQKLQQETMALYKENKVSPLGGCLPTLIQIPVFIALYVVLRSAVELRFAPFLWIRDLSDQEALWPGLLPISFNINILPLFMAATMAWQQKLTPAGGDPAQQKIMMLMPLMMLFLFYNMPSALLVYWSVNQCLMIVQLLMMQRKKAKEELGGKGSGPTAKGKAQRAKG